MAEIQLDNEATVAMSARDFWNKYFGGHLVSVTRDSKGGCYGRSIDFSKERSRMPTETSFRTSREDLEEYEYLEDVRFSVGVYSRLNDAIKAVINAPLMQRESVPNSDQLRFLITVFGYAWPEASCEYSRLRSWAMELLDKIVLSPASLEDTLQRLKPGAKEYQNYRASGEVKALNAEREIILKSYGAYFTDWRAKQQLQAVVDNQEYEDVQTVKIALWALGRQNNKASIPWLLNCLNMETYAYFSVDIQRALQFICSSSELIPLVEEDPIDHWLGRIGKIPDAHALKTSGHEVVLNSESESSLKVSTEDIWAEWDARSVFWEKRLRCAAQWAFGNMYSSLLQALAEDEVYQVRHASVKVGVGELYHGKVVGIKEFGAFVEILPDKDGLLHISEIADYRVNQVEDVLKLGDEVWVKVLAVDKKGHVRLSRKAAMGEQSEKA